MYKINEKDRIIVCIIETVNEVEKRVRKYGVNGNFNGDSNPIVKRYVGKAKCSPEDQWNENYGKNLAKYRALVKRAKDVNQEIDKIIESNLFKINILREKGKIKIPEYKEYQEEDLENLQENIENENDLIPNIPTNEDTIINNDNEINIDNNDNNDDLNIDECSIDGFDF